MPAVQPPAKVLVTGASGFIGSSVAQALVDKGFFVVGTVRSNSKGDYLKKLLGDKFSYVIVEDIQSPGAFDEAVKGVDAVEHTASPVILSADDPQILIRPALEGTLGVLNSIAKHGDRVKRVVLTSSVAAVYEPKEGNSYTFTEADWNSYSAGLIEREGRNAPGIHKYRTSKVLAEKAAWDFVEKNKDSIQWDLVTILPPLVFGPTIHDVKDLISLNASAAMFHQAITDFSVTKEQALAPIGNTVDVRDVALAHVLSLQVEEAGGQRFLPTTGPFVWQDFYDLLNEAGVENIPKGFPGAQKGIQAPVIADGSKVERVLGLKYHTRKDTAIDAVKSLRSRFPN